MSTTDFNALKLLAVSAVFVVSLVACAPAATQVAPTSTPPPTDTPQPSATPSRTALPTETSSPEPSPTAASTNTATAEPTPAPVFVSDFSEVVEGLDNGSLSAEMPITMEALQLPGLAETMPANGLVLDNLNIIFNAKEKTQPYVEAGDDGIQLASEFIAKVRAKMRDPNITYKIPINDQTKFVFVNVSPEAAAKFGNTGANGEAEKILAGAKETNDGQEFIYGYLRNYFVFNQNANVVWFVYSNDGVPIAHTGVSPSEAQIFMPLMLLTRAQKGAENDSGGSNMPWGSRYAVFRDYFKLEGNTFMFQEDWFSN